MFRWTVQIDKWDNQLDKWDFLNNKTTNLLVNILSKDPEFSKYYSLFLRRPEQSVIDKVLKNEPSSITPFIFIANSDTDFYEKFVTDNVIETLLAYRNSIGNTYYKMFQVALINHISKKTSSKRLQLVRSFFEKSPEKQIYNNLLKTGILSDNGYEKLVNYCANNNINETHLTPVLGIQINKYQELYRSLEIDLFLEKLKNTDYSKESNLIRIIHKNDLFNKELGNGLLLGHEIIKSVITNSKSVEVHSDWTELILSIASDPRSSKLSPKYLKWWALIDENLRKRFIQILSHADILIFLDAFEQFAKKEDRNMARMFKSRKQFLVGLSQQNLINDSRLFLPNEIKRYIKKERPHLDTSYIAETYGHGNTCIIYLKVGPFYIIEGSHNCQIWVYDENPFPYDITQKQKYSRSYRELTMGLSEDFYDRNLREPYHKVHSYQGYWKIEVIGLLKSRISIDADQLMLQDEITTYNYILRRWRTR